MTRLLSCTLLIAQSSEKRREAVTSEFVKLFSMAFSKNPHGNSRKFKIKQIYF